MTDKILSAITPAYGFCPFNMISDSLIDCRAKSRIPENAQTIIMCLFPYFLGEDAYKGSDISKYAVVPDYHDIVLNLLSNACNELKTAFPDDEFVPFADNSPVPEVKAAVYAGLGVKGRNGLLINSDYGSWVFIGEIITTKKYNFNFSNTVDCISCGRCVKMCPTASITDSGVTKSTCLSDITQRKGALSGEEQKLIKDTGCIWGCDVCQNVCPMNQNIKITPLKQFINGVKLNADANNLEGRAYAWRGQKVIERNIEILYKESKK